MELDKSTYKEYNLEMQKKMKNSIINMKRSLFVSAMMIGLFASAGNEDRVGSSGASMLLVNPWARSSALGDANIANAKGLEASYLNIAGLAFTDKTQLKFNTANWMGSAGIQFYSAGIAQGRTVPATPGSTPRSSVCLSFRLLHSFRWKVF